MAGYKLKKKQKTSIIEISLSVILFAAAAIVDALEILPQNDYTWLITLAIYLPAYIAVGRRVLWRAVQNIFRGQVFDENFLMSLATIGAIIIGEYPEAVFVMLFYRVGELFEQIAVGKSRASIASLMEIRPDSAAVLRNGEYVTVMPEEVKTGEIIIVKTGEKIPLDGIVTDGTSSLDTVALTGESLPRDVSVGDSVPSGCVNLGALLHIEVRCEYENSTVSKILSLVESATDAKSKSENFITKFAKIYTPAVVFAALAIAIIPPLILDGGSEIFTEWIYRAMSFLVISCPCALVISVPLTFFGGIGRAAREGILIKGSTYIETLAKVSTVVFDKTGTLTEGKFKVTKIIPSDGVDEMELLKIAASAECMSTHPIAFAVCEKYEELSSKKITPAESICEIAGKGSSALLFGKNVLVGNSKLMADNGIVVPEMRGGSVVYAAYDGKFIGSVVVSDSVKQSAPKAIEALRGGGVFTAMLTGDKDEVAEGVAKATGVDEYRSQLLPQDKLMHIEDIINKHPENIIAFVGDGINDAPSLARADVGIAMGGIGSDAAVEAADVVIMDDDPQKLVRAMHLSRKTVRIVKENIIVVLFVKAAALLLGAFGLTGMWFAVFADVGISVIAILNALKIFKA